MLFNILRKTYRILKNTLNIKYPIFTCQFKKYSNYEIGPYTYGTPTIIDIHNKNYRGNYNNIKIGNFCSIAQGVTFSLAPNHRMDWITTYPIHVFFKNNCFLDGYPEIKGDTIIGNDVWIGINAFILAGIKVGNGAVIGANTVVTKDVPPYAIVAGNPAKIIRYRFNTIIIDELQKIEWWNWPIDKIIEESFLLQSSKIENFVNKYKK